MYENEPEAVMIGEKGKQLMLLLRVVLVVIVALKIIIDCSSKNYSTMHLDPTNPTVSLLLKVESVEEDLEAQRLSVFICSLVSAFREGINGYRLFHFLPCV